MKETSIYVQFSFFSKEHSKKNTKIMYIRTLKMKYIYREMIKNEGHNRVLSKQRVTLNTADAIYLI